MNASVKVMNSYDYCHFEVALSAEDVTLEDADNMRKDAQRLVDKAIKQYKIAKSVAANMGNIPYELERKAKAIKENYPQSEWTAEQMATVKAFEDASFRAQFVYDYQDEFEEPEIRY